MGYSIFTDTMVDMTWPQIDAAAKRGAVVLLPIGIIEEHGPHLGLAVDLYSAYLVAVKTRKLLADMEVEALIAPPQYWGISRATAIFAGTFSVRPDTMKGLIVDIVANLRNWGFEKVFTVNWHADIEHCRVLLEAVERARQETGLDVRYMVTESDLRRLRVTGNEDTVLLQKNAPALDMGTGPYIDVHAGSMETAVMMKYFPEGIDADFVRRMESTKLTAEDLRGFGRSEEETRRLTPDGYFGDPAAYDTDAAVAYVDAVASSYAEAIAEYLEQ